MTKKSDIETVLLSLRPGKNAENTPKAMETILSALHGFLIKKKTPTFTLEIANIDGQIRFFARVPSEMEKSFTRQIYAQYPDSEVEKWKPDAFSEISKEANFSWAEAEFSAPDLFPIRRYHLFEDMFSKNIFDPISGILLPLAFPESSGQKAGFSIVLTPLDPSVFHKKAKRFLRIFSQKSLPHSDFLRRKCRKAFFLSSFSFFGNLLWRLFFRFLWIKYKRNSDGGEIEEKKAIAEKMLHLPFLANIRFFASCSKGESPEKIQEMTASFQQFHAPNLNHLKIGKIHAMPKIFQKRQQRRNRASEMILSADEIATIFHLPSREISVPFLDRIPFRTFEPPKNLLFLEKKKTKAVALGQVFFRGDDRTFGIGEDDRRRHIYIAGKTGMGKSTLLENMIFSDISAGNGVGVIDPHGDLAEAALRFVPKNRRNDVILFDPADRSFPISFNILECRENGGDRHLVASGVVGVFKKIFAESWGPRLEHILRNTILALAEAGGTSLLGIPRMLADQHYREEILARVSDPVVLGFWRDEFNAWQPKQRAEAIAPIQNKVGQFLSSSLVRNILGQTKSSFDFRFAMDRGKIFIANLSKGKIGEDVSALLGALLVSKFQIDAMSRASVSASDRRDFYLYVDEFQNFATDAFATILSEARKYRLNLTVANQYLGQMPEEIQSALFGNVGTMICFQVGFDDAKIFSDQFGGEETITPMDIGSLSKYHTYLRLLIDGVPTSVFSARTLPPPQQINEGDCEIVRRISRERYSQTQKSVEEKIKKWAFRNRQKNHKSQNL